MDKIELEERLIELETVENVLTVYQEFVDNECPTKDRIVKSDDSRRYCIFASYAARAEKYNSLLNTALDMLAKVRADLACEVYGNE